MRGVALHDIIYDTEGKPADYVITDVNRSYERILHLSGKDIVGRTATEIYSSDTAPYLKEYSAVAHSGSPYKFETYYQPMEKYFYISVSPLGENSFATIFLDITEQKHVTLELQQAHVQVQSQNEELRAANEELVSLYQQLSASDEELRLQFNELKESQRRLRDQEERFRLALEASNDVLYDWDIMTHKVHWSNHWEARLGFSHDDEGATDALFAAVVHPEDCAARENALKDHLEGKKPFYTAEFRLRDIHGDYFWALTRGKVLRDANGTAVRVLGSLTDITESKLRHEKIRHMAYHDVLTGLPNRLMLTERLEEEMARAHSGECQGALLFLDIDNFKMINDSLGHSFGDKILIDVGRQITEKICYPHLVARWGADEFIVLLSGISDRKVVEEYASSLLMVFNQPYEREEQRVFLTASIGVAIFPTDGVTADELLRSADMAMHEVKKSGKNAWRFFDDSMRNAVVHKMHLETDLRSAVRNKEFVLHYQPIIALSSGSIVGFEALLRWKNKERGLVPPLTFVPLAEETGLILSIGKWVLREACNFGQCLRLAGKTDLFISVNISVRQMAQDDFVDMVMNTLAESGFPSECLELEITETVLIEAFESNIQKLERLRDLGVRIALDDFGTGYSSLTYLKRLPIHKVKIDKSFVDDLNGWDERSAIFGAIIDLSHGMGLLVVAEGVEREDQRKALIKHSCDQIQGYLISRPVRESEVCKLLGILN